MSRRIAEAVVAHYAVVKRDLPWRRTRDPYAIWISEVMLQQTRVATVIPYWERWLARFPTVAALAAAPLDDVLAHWAGLGYYSRARNLHAAAQQLGDQLPRSAAELRAVRGIGPYTAGAIASIAYGERVPLVDGNVARVVARLFAIELDIKSTAGGKALWQRAAEIMQALPETSAPGDLNQGLMELGATLCSPTAPRCLVCPIATACAAARQGRQHELPVVAARKAERDLPLVERTLVWIEEDGELLVGRRVRGGLFGGLWELPELAAAERLGVTLDHTCVAHHAQTLTHRRLRLTSSLSDPHRLVAAVDPSYDASIVSRSATSPGRRRCPTNHPPQLECLPGARSKALDLFTRLHQDPRRLGQLGTTSATRTSRTPRPARPRASTSSSTTRGRSSSR